MQKIYPFKFLDSYTREDKDFFFGRDEEIETLYRMCFQSNIMLVYGTSGTGKTSLIQCGLANKFQSYDWSDLFIRRGENMVYSFDKALCEASDGVFAGPGDISNSIKNLAEKVDAVYNASFKPIYLIFDQFEELYILGDLKEQKGFIKVIQDLISLQRPVKVIISIREEYLGYLYEFEKKVPELLRKKLRVEPMNEERVTSVIKKIGSSTTSNVSLEQGKEDQIAENIFKKLKGDDKTLTIQLPYLQVFLDTLYLKITKDESRTTPAVFTLQHLEAIGDIGDVLRNFLDEQVMQTAQKLDEKPETIWKILSPFVTLDGTKEPLSANQLYDRFEEEPKPLLDNIIQAFVKSRILRFTEKDQRYEIAHDSLAKQVNAKRSDEEIAILEVQRLIKSQVSVKPEAREFFTERQLLFIEPYLEKFKESDAEAEWINKSRENVEELKRKEEERKEEERVREQKRKDDERKREEEELKREQKRKDEEIAAEQQRKALELAKTRKWLMIFGGLFILAVLALFAAYFFYKNAKANEDFAKKESENAKKSAITAQENLVASYISDTIRYSGEIKIASQNIETFSDQYKAGKDVILIEEQKINGLKERIDSLKDKIKDSKLRIDSLKGNIKD